MAIIKPEQLSSGPYNISGSFSGSFQGDGSGLINIPTQSFETGSFVTTSSFNTFTGSYNTGSFSGSFEGTASYALTASYLEGGITIDTGSFATTGSNTFIGDQTISGSMHQSGTFYPNQIDWFSSSIGYDTGSYILTTTANGLTTYVNYQDTANTLAPYIPTVSSSISASYADTANSVNDLNQNVLVSGTLTVLGGATFYGSSSFVYVTASQLAVSASFISVNVFEPAQRFGGLIVYDSGSSLATASLAWDSLHNHWVYQNVSGATYTGGMLLSGPRNTGSLGDEPNLTQWYIPRGDGGDHLNDSQIYSSASIHIVTGSLTVTQGITGSLLGTASYATQALSASFAPATPPFPFTGSALITGSLGVTGSLTTLGTSSITNPTQLSGNQTTSPLLTLNQSLQGFGNSSVMFRASETSVNNSFAVELYKRSGNSETRFLAGGNGTGTNTERSFMTVIGTNTAGDGSVTFDRSVGIGSTPSSSIRLDVRAQGVSSTDIAFRVRNSADNADVFSIRGNNDIYLPSTTNNSSASIYLSGTTDALIRYQTAGQSGIAFGHNSAFNTGTSYNTIVGGSSTTSATTGMGVIVGWGNSITAENYGIIVGSQTKVNGLYTIRIGHDGGASSYGGTHSIHLGKTVSGNNIAIDNVLMNYFNSQSPSVVIRSSGSLGLLGQQAYMLSNGTGLYGIETYMGNGGNTLVVTNHPSIPSTNITNSFQQYSADIVAGNAAPHFRTENGSIIKLYQQSAVTSSQGIADVLTNLGFLTGSSVIPSGGPFGIANSSGVYTYYTTFSASMAAATSGQTVEMFADITETGSVTVTLKNGVNINGNGHTYTLNNSGLTHALTVPVTVETSCNILNLNVIRTGSTGSLADNSALVLGTNGTGTINCNGSTFRNLVSGSGILFNTNSGHEINYAVAYAKTTWGAIAMFTSYGARLNNSIGYGTSGGIGIRCHNGGDIQHCTGVSDSSYGIYGLSGNQSNSVGISATGNGFFAAATAFNCVGRSTSGIGFEAQNGTNIVGCVGISVSGRGLATQNAIIHNCTGVSNSSSGMSLAGVGKAYNITAKSSTSYALWGTLNTTQIYGGTIVCDWNNAAGYGIRGNGGFISNVITNCTFTLSNASAPYLFNDGFAQAITMRGNTYQGGAVFNANLTQATAATQDNQGNIFL